MKALELERVSHAFNEVLAVDDVTLTLEPGEFVCLLGPSGCGKTTVLRIAAGLESLQRGRVLIAGEVVADARHSVPPEARGVGLVFQDYALFPHLSAADNVAFGLPREPASRQRVGEVLRQVGMSEHATAYPHMLSGGEQQRIALARALAPQPRLMLLDEPFSGLDARLRDQVRDQTLHVLKSGGTATLMVTHDPEEAMFMADRIAVMRKGRLVQVGTPSDLYFRPADAFVAAFFGEVNRLTGRAVGRIVPTPFGPLAADGHAEGAAVEVLIRPEGLRVRSLGQGEEGAAEARVLAARMLGRSSLVHLALAAPEGTLHLHARVPGQFLPPEDSRVALTLDRSQAFVFPLADGGGGVAAP